ncbi:MAG: GntR family transcriptional regulator [Clostridia bacterium]|nr:GntR family transcriptional regulator [Clostridia bacterium]
MGEERLNRESGQLLYRQIVDAIMEQIRSGSFSFDEPICTEAELINRFNVSRITVRRALGELESRGILYRKRGVGSFVSSTVYQDEVARGNVTTSTPSSGSFFAFVLPFNISRTGLTSAFHAATEWLNERGCMTSIYISEDSGDNRGRNILRRLAQMNVTGVAYYPYTANIHLEIVDELMMSGKPVVLMDLPGHCAHLASVTSDNLSGSRELMRHLLSLGHRRIAFLSGIPPEGRETLRDRYSGYLLSLTEAGVRPDPALIRFDMNQDNRILPANDPRSLVSALKQFHASGATAVICEHDEIAHHVVMACRDMNLRVPEDMSVCGFDNNEWAAMIPGKRVTTVAQDWAAIGRTVAELLYRGVMNPLTQHQPTVVPTSLVVGDTTGPAQKSAPPHTDDE